MNIVFLVYQKKWQKKYSKTIWNQLWEGFAEASVKIDMKIKQIRSKEASFENIVYETTTASIQIPGLGYK